MSCASCRYWVRGDQTPRNDIIGNAGNCTYLLLRADGFYSKPQHVPFWARELLHQTIDWQGDNCPTYSPNQMTRAKTAQVQYLDISVRAARILKEHGVTSVADLLGYTRKQLLAMPGMGKRSLDDIEAILDNYDLRLKEKES